MSANFSNFALFTSKYFAMRIAVNARFLIKNKLEGIGRYSFEMLKRIVQQHPEHEFIFFFDRDFDDEFIFGKNVKAVKLFPPARHPFLFVIFFEIAIRRSLKKYKADVFLSTDGFLCLGCHLPQISVIHDLAFEHYPKDIGLLQLWYYKYFFPRFAHKAASIVTVSEYSKTDIASTYGIDKKKITVTYNAAGSIFRPADEKQHFELKQKFTHGKPYFIYVGALQPRKNISRMLQAFDQFKTSDLSDHKLLIVGRMAWKTEAIEKTYSEMRFKEEVIFTGRVSDSELAGLMGAATSLIYIPYLEGFGLPLVEAMQCGTPVITSNLTAMPEVAANSGLLINPFDVLEITEAMKEISSNQKLRMTLAENAIRRAKDFNWENSAAQLWKCLIATVNQNLV